MATLIIPCGGKSSRFPNMKPKWLLTHPDGQLMIQKSLEGIDVSKFDRFIVTIILEHDEKYFASTILKQALKEFNNLEICVLDNFTSSASETVYQTLKKMNVVGGFVVKDSDNKVNYNLPDDLGNYIVSFNVTKHPNVGNLPGKSFLVVNNNGIILDIAEKKIISDNVCLGVYSFQSARLFKSAYESVMPLFEGRELFISRIVSYLINEGKYTFTAIEANHFEDWGTIKEWKDVQESHSTFFVDVDGVLLKNVGKYGIKNWDNSNIPIYENLEKLKKLYDNGAQIVITTARPEKYRDCLEKMLSGFGIKPVAIVMGLNHAPRVIINDFAPTNPYPSCRAISIPRNSLINDYIS